MTWRCCVDTPTPKQPIPCLPSRRALPWSPMHQRYREAGPRCGGGSAISITASRCEAWRWLGCTAFPVALVHPGRSQGELLQEDVLVHPGRPQGGLLQEDVLVYSGRSQGELLQEDVLVYPGRPQGGLLQKDAFVHPGRSQGELLQEDVLVYPGRSQGELLQKTCKKRDRYASFSSEARCSTLSRYRLRR